MSDTHDKALATVPARDLPERISPVVQMGMDILRENPDPDALGKLLALQREWEAQEALRLFNVALHALKESLPQSIVKRHPVNDKAGNLMYRHATLVDVMDAVSEPMRMHGFTVTWQPSCEGGLVHVRCNLHHIGGHVAETSMSAPPDKGQNRNAVQAIGSTQTYLQRYTLCALLGLAAVDQDDADDTTPSAPGPSDVDQGANQKALAWLQRHGWTEEDCVRVTGRPREEWTAADLAALKRVHQQAAKNVAAKAAEPAKEPDPAPPAEVVDQETGEVLLTADEAAQGWELDANGEKIPPAGWDG